MADAGARPPVDFRALLDAIPQLAWIASPSGELVYVGAGWPGYTGVSERSLLTSGWSGVVHPDDRELALEGWRRALAAREPYEVQCRIRAADGTYRWFLVRAHRLAASSVAAHIEWAGTCTDIDALKSAEVTAGEDAAAFRALGDAIPQIVWSAKPDGYIDWYNHGWYDFTGQTEAEAAGWGWQAVHHPEDFPEVMKRWPHSIASGEPFEMEFRLRGRDGAFCWFLTRVHPLRDDEGRIVRWYGTNTNIEGQKRTENDLAFLAKASTVLASTVDIRATLRDVARIAVDAYCDFCYFDVLNEARSLERVAWARAGARAFEAWPSGAAFSIPASGQHPRLRALRGEATLAGPIDEAWIAAMACDPEEAALLHGVDARYLIAVPAVVRGRPSGVLTFGRSTRSDRHFVHADLALAEDLGRRVGVAVENAQAYQRERHVAMTLQEAFLPKALPKTAGIEFDATYMPGKNDAEVGGDWYDAFRLPDGRLAITIGDVCGNGLAAAAVMGKLRQAMQSAAMIQPEPSAMLDAADFTLRLHDGSMIATALAGILDPVDLTLTYASAGHPSPLLWETSGFTEYIGAEPPLGLRDMTESTSQVIRLSRGAFLVLYTDGLIESTHDLEEGERRLRAAVADDSLRESARPSRAIFDSVLFDGSRDDVAIMTVSIARIAHPGGAASPGIAVEAHSSSDPKRYSSAPAAPRRTS